MQFGEHGDYLIMTHGQQVILFIIALVGVVEPKIPFMVFAAMLGAELLK